MDDETAKVDSGSESAIEFGFGFEVEGVEGEGSADGCAGAGGGKAGLKGGKTGGGGGIIGLNWFGRSKNGLINGGGSSGLHCWNGEVTKSNNRSGSKPKMRDNKNHNN